MDEGPVVALSSAARARRSGEFIFASSAVEVHVYLQRGRLAWATDSSHPLEFARTIKQRCRIDDDAFREVLEECRRQRCPVGETLVAWDLATWDDVRASLRRQIVLALATLAQTPRGSAMFLTRERFEDYDDALTFDLGELLAELDRAQAPAKEPPGRASNAPSSRPAPTAETPASSAGVERPEATLPTVAAADALAAIRGAAWVVVQDGASADAATRGAAAVVPQELRAASLGDGADFLALRGSGGSLVAARLAPFAAAGPGDSRSLWCMLDDDATFRPAVASMAGLGLLRPTRRERRVTIAPLAWRHGALRPAWVTEIEQVFAYDAEVCAVVLLSNDGEALGGVGRASLDLATCSDLARRRARVLAAWSGAAPDAPGRSGAVTSDTRGRGHRTMVTGEARVWCFGAEVLHDGEPATLWILVGRDASQGVGWACLTALLRGHQQADEAST